jgi:hypothetical protein
LIFVFLSAKKALGREGGSEQSFMNIRLTGLGNERALGDTSRFSSGAETIPETHPSKLSHRNDAFG